MTLYDPKNDLNSYNKIVEYADMANELESEVREDIELSFFQKIHILFPLIDEMKENGQNLIDDYIIYIKDFKNLIKLNALELDIENMLEKIDFFKNKIYELYNINKR